VAYVWRKLRNWIARITNEAGIDAYVFFCWGVGGKKNRIVEVVIRTADGKLAVLYVSADVSTDLDVVVLVSDRNDILVGVNVVVKGLGIS